MTYQDLVNTRQTSINKRQTNINDDQNTINEETKVNLPIKNFWILIITIISATSIYLGVQFKSSNDISQINTKLTYISNSLEKHLSDSEQARRDMKIVAKNRDDNFALIFSDIKVIKQVLKIQ